MAQYLLDTNICGFLFRNKYGVPQKIREIGLSNCAVSQLTVVELMVGFEYSKLKNGIDQSKRLEEFLKFVQVIPLDDVLSLAAHEKARLQLAGTPAHDLVDVLIACTAIHYEMVMVTENTKHFMNFKGITLENWVQRDS